MTEPWPCGLERQRLRCGLFGRLGLGSELERLCERCSDGEVGPLKRGEESDMRRALVLGGGGPVGIAWEAGLLAGLGETGVDLSAADLFVGTSAGSVVGAQLALGRTPRQIYERQTLPAEPGGRTVRPVDLSGLIARYLRFYSADQPVEQFRAELGRFALEAETGSEEEWLAGFQAVEAMGEELWPSRDFVCTAIDTADGAFVAWDRASGVPLSKAVASSCAVPGIFPPVTIGGRRYMDGGIGSATNATLAASYERVVVVAVTSAAAGGGDIGAAIRRRFDEELDELRASGSSVDVVRPGDEFVQKLGVNVMDFTRRQEAAEIGLRQGHSEAERLGGFWSSHGP